MASGRNTSAEQARVTRVAALLLGPAALLTALTSVAGGCSAPVPGDAASPERPVTELEQELMEADARFALATAKRGLDGWVDSFTDDAARIDLHGEIARGHRKIRSHDAGLFADPKTRLMWEPTDAGVFDDLRHGFTRGRYELIKKETDGSAESLSRGAYLTIWRHEDGGWKILVDTGAPDPDEAGG
ncbi:MAG: hypothetical protein OEQ13_02875 [Acidobacteriota bacterium]|nr:hypothetical protein [Acidobacteriota bacterium]